MEEVKQKLVEEFIEKTRAAGISAVELILMVAELNYFCIHALSHNVREAPLDQWEKFK